MRLEKLLADLTRAELDILDRSTRDRFLAWLVERGRADLAALFAQAGA